MPEGAVYVGRPTKWGNIYHIGRDGDQQACVDSFRATFADGLLRQRAERELRGKDLACFCRIDQPCHADVLLEWANAACVGVGA